MIGDFTPGDLVVSTRPDPDRLPYCECLRVGLVVALVPPRTSLHQFSCSMVLVLWVDPMKATKMNCEPDGRLRVIPVQDIECLG